MTPDGELDPGSLRRQVEFLIAAGVSGLWVNGTTGEFFALEADERAAVVAEVVRAAAGWVPVIAQVGDTVTRRAARHALAAAEAGADYAAAVAPYYVAFSQAELLSYYRDLAATVPLP